MATLWLPAVLLLPWLVPRWREALAQRDARVLLPLGFVLLYLLFFTLTRGKRDLYILSALPMLALPAGYLLPALLQRVGVQRLCLALRGIDRGGLRGVLLWLGCHRRRRAARPCWRRWRGELCAAGAARVDHAGRAAVVGPERARIAQSSRR